jgi:hypothetical protein
MSAHYAVERFTRNDPHCARGRRVPQFHTRAVPAFRAQA